MCCEMFVCLSDLHIGVLENMLGVLQCVKLENENLIK